MIDIHIHILPGLDDGAASWTDSLEMARTAVEDGVTDMIVTPHFNHSFYNTRLLVERRTAELQQLLDSESVPLTVYPGNEVRIESAEYVRDHARLGSFSLLGPTNRFVLLEQRWKGYEEATPELVRWFKERGIQVIVPHPERHDFFRREPELLVSLIELGAWTQVTADSLSGRNHPDVQAFAEWLVRQGYAHTLATDAHNMSRKPNLSKGYAAVERIAGAGAAQAIRDRMRQLTEAPTD